MKDHNKSLSNMQVIKNSFYKGPWTGLHYLYLICMSSYDALQDILVMTENILTNNV